MSFQSRRRAGRGPREARKQVSLADDKRGVVTLSRVSGPALHQPED